MAAALTVSLLAERAARDVSTAGSCAHVQTTIVETSSAPSGITFE